MSELNNDNEDIRDDIEYDWDYDDKTGDEIIKAHLTFHVSYRLDAQMRNALALEEDDRIDIIEKEMAIHLLNYIKATMEGYHDPESPVLKRLHK